MSNNNHHHVMGSISEDKKLKVYEQVQGIDRISGLPDSILGKILSILPTKTAAATTILSTRWKNLFPFQVWPIYLAFDDTHLLHNTNSRSPVTYLSFFRDFVDKLLFNETLIVADSMLLRCRRRNNSYNSHGDAKILSWVRAAALRLKVQHLSLEFCLYLDDHQPLFDILNGCSTLVSLTLGLDIELFLPQNFTLPNLKRLKLSEMVFDDEEGLSITKLLIGCPALEEFSMIRCSILHQFISINSPLLKSLTISESLSSYTSVCYVDIVAPNLQVLMFNCFAARKYCLSSFNSLISAHIDIGPTMEQVPNRYRPYLLDCDFDDEGAWFVYKGAANLVTACSNTVNLYLAARSIDALHHSSVLLPAFLNLTWLSLGSLGCHGWALLARLLHSSPYLKRLTFEGVFEKNKGSYADLQCLVSSPAKCLGLHVRKIEFRVFDCKVEETTLLKYFLKNGKVLEKVILSCLPHHIERLPMLRGHPKIVLEPR